MSLFLLFSLASAQPAAPVPIPAANELREQIAAADARLFWAAFEGCAPEALGDVLAPDFRMIHDRAGLAVESRAAFLESMERQCAAREPGGENPGYANRRLIVPGTRIIRPMGDWGALEQGEHVFFERRASGAWELVGGARYMHLWQWMPAEGKFRLTQSYSYDHGAAAPYPGDPSDEPAQ